MPSSHKGLTLQADISGKGLFINDVIIFGGCPQWTFEIFNYLFCFYILTLSSAGMAELAPPIGFLLIPEKKLMGKVVIFFIFPKYRNGRLGTSF